MREVIAVVMILECPACQCTNTMEIMDNEYNGNIGGDIIILLECMGCGSQLKLEVPSTFSIEITRYGE